MLSLGILRSFAGNNNKNSIGGALGTALGVAAPCIGVIVWLAVTYSYRQEKRRLMAAIVTHLTPNAVSDKDPLGFKPPPTLTRQLDRDDSAAGFIIPAHREPEPSPAMVKVVKEMTHRQALVHECHMHPTNSVEDCLMSSSVKLLLLLLLLLTVTREMTKASFEACLTS